MRQYIIFGIALLLAGCGSSQSYFDPTVVQYDERTGAKAVITPDLQPLPTTREQPVPIEQGPASTQPDYDNAPVIRMTLEEIIHRAVLNNHDVKVAGYEPA